MSSYRFRKGMRIELRGREYVIEQRLPNGDLQLKDVALNECQPLPESALIDALFDGEMEFLGEGKENSLIRRKMVKAFVDDLTMLDKDDPRRKEAKRRYAYVRAIEAESLTRRMTPEVLQAIVKNVHQTIQDPNELIPHWKTVYYVWFKTFMDSGCDIRALVPDYKRRGNIQPRFAHRAKRKGEKFTESEKRKAKEVAQIVQEVIDEFYLNLQRLSVADVYDRLDIRIADINKFRDPDDQLPIPHKDSIYDIVSRMDEYVKDAARYGKKYAEEKHGQRKRGPRPTRPLERVEIDHTILDLFIVDPVTRLPLGRPTLTTAIDKRSGMILGMHVGFDPPGYLAVMRCLLHAITPKTYLKTDFPMVQNEWKTYGLPEVLVVDNGPEFHGDDLEDACLQLGIVILYCIVKNPKYKAAIERFFGTQNKRLLHRQPGTTFSNIVDRGDYDPKKNAVISFDAFMEMLHVWIVDVYSQDVHRGLKDIPAHLWDEGVKDYPPALPRRKQELRIVMGMIEHRSVKPTGIELYNLVYNDERLAALRRELKGEKVKLKINPDDLSIINAYDPKNDLYIPVPAEDQEYTKGLSLWQHGVIKAYNREKLKLRVNRDNLRRAKKTIIEIVDREWFRSGKSGARAKMARWNRIRQPDYGAKLEMGGIREQRTRSQGQVEGKLLMMKPVIPASEGISAVGTAPMSSTVSERAESGVNAYSGVIEMAPAAKQAKNKKSQTKKSENRRHARNAESPQPTENENRVEVTTFLPQDDDEVVTTGYSASFDLPAREA